MNSRSNQDYLNHENMGAFSMGASDSAVKGREKHTGNIIRIHKRGAVLGERKNWYSLSAATTPEFSQFGRDVKLVTMRGEGSARLQ